MRTASRFETNLGRRREQAKRKRVRAVELDGFFTEGPLMDGLKDNFLLWVDVCWSLKGGCRADHKVFPGVCVGVQYAAVNTEAKQKQRWDAQRREFEVKYEH